MTELVEISILGKSYQVACKDEEMKSELLLAAHELNERMQKIRRSGSVVGQERIAVMTALNLCHELQTSKKNGTVSEGDELQILERMSEKINAILDE